MDVVPEEDEIKHPDEENNGKKKSKQIKMAKNASVHEGKKQFKCDICDAKYGHNHHLNRHVATVHEGKKQFKCDVCNVKFGQKCDLNKHVFTVHESNKPLQSIVDKLMRRGTVQSPSP